MTSIARILGITRVRLNALIMVEAFPAPDVSIGILRPHVRGRGWRRERVIDIADRAGWPLRWNQYAVEYDVVPRRYMSLDDCAEMVPLTAAAIRKRIEGGAFVEPAVRIDGAQWRVPGYDVNEVANYVLAEWGGSALHSVAAFCDPDDLRGEPAAMAA